MKSLFSKIVFALLFSLFPLFASADIGNITGWAWSDTIGWISFTCVNTGTCASSSGVDYGVTQNASGDLTGYAWSENIGWIQFGGLSGFPAGAGTTAANARLTGGTVTGWARACSGTQGGNCSSMTSRTDGWDGWIALSGATYGVTKSGDNFLGYGWGSDVIGWTLFDIQNKFPAICSNCGPQTGGSSADLDVRSGGAGGPTIVGNGAVPFGTIPTFVWTINSTTMSCDVTKLAGGTAFTAITGRTTSGSQSGNALTSPGLHTYHLECTNPAFTKDVSFTVAPMAVGFSLGGTETARIQFLGPGAANSEIKTIYVSPGGGFTEPVSISITGYPTPPAGTTFTYSLGGGAFVANPAPVVISSPYGSGQTFQVRVSKPITTPYTITLTGQSASAGPVTKDIILDPRGFDPSFNEI